MNSKKPILLVEDDQVDVMNIQRAIKELRVINTLNITRNGEEGLAFLKNPDNEQPCVILLDLNMPKMNGIEFLRALKQEPDLRMIPVVILTTSKEELDRSESFQLGAAGYMIKPVEYQQFLDVIRTIDLYWTLSELPE
ncbi:MAG: response regulator [Candidatus Omnitrophota bacterium]